jgi:protein-disulfide isomerase
MKRFVLRIFALIAITALAPIAASAQSPAFTPAQEQALRAIIRDYIMKNPEVILEALDAFEEKRKAETERTQQDAVKRRAVDLTGDTEAPTLGATNADVTIVEFFDYRCTYCKQVTGPLLDLLRSDRRLRVVFKELPILGPDSVVAARAALAAHRQGGYEKLHRLLMSRRGTLDETTILAAVREAGLDADRLRADMADPRIQAQIDRNLALARELGVRGTPAFVIGERLIPGAIDAETMKRLVAEARKR